MYVLLSAFSPKISSIRTEVHKATSKSLEYKYSSEKTFSYLGYLIYVCAFECFFP